MLEMCASLLSEHKDVRVQSHVNEDRGEIEKVQDFLGIDHSRNREPEPEDKAACCCTDEGVKRPAHQIRCLVTNTTAAAVVINVRTATNERFDNRLSPQMP